MTAPLNESAPIIEALPPEQPYYWLNKDSRLFLERGYLKDGQTAEDRIEVIARAAERILRNKDFSAKFISYMRLGYYSLSSPIWANFGLERGLPISCFGSYIADSLDSILHKMAEVGMMTKMGGGTSAYFGEVRARGSEIKSGGKSNGAVHFMKLFESVTDVVSQSNVRRGSFAAYLPIEHPDILEFLQIRADGNSVQNISIGVTIRDTWMKSMVYDKDKDKRKIWGKLIQKRFESGYPYIMFIDTVNKNSPDVYRDKGIRIHASNLCVTGDTEIVISESESGVDPVTYKIDRFTELWEIGHWHMPRAYVKSSDSLGNITWNLVFATAITGQADELIEITGRTGAVIRCTPEHMIYTKSRGWIQAQELTEIDELLETETDILYWNISMVKIKLKSKVPVFDLTVPGSKSFFANGILIHNCSEINLSSAEDESFVCNLSSMNLLHYDSWKTTDAVETLTYFLDAVMTEFIDKTAGISFMEAPRKFAQQQRALGIGVLGWHSYLQSKMIPFESLEAKLLNTGINSLISQRANLASRALATEFGEPPLLKGYGRRNVTLTAVAPTTSSSFILGQVSPSVEPLNSNYFVKDLAKGKFTFKNKYLENVLADHDKNDHATWHSILVKGGSVQHLKFLSEHEKNVFKTFGEISQKEIIIQASARQKYIDQSQSINLMIHPKTSVKDVNQLLIFAWELGVKTLYYHRGTNPSQELSRNLLQCSSCES